MWEGGRKAGRKTSMENQYRKPGKPRHMREIVRILFIKKKKKHQTKTKQKGGERVLNVFAFRVLPVHYSKTHYLNPLYRAINILFKKESC